MIAIPEMFDDFVGQIVQFQLTMQPGQKVKQCHRRLGMPVYSIRKHCVCACACVHARPGHKILSKFQAQGQITIFIFKTRTKYFAA